MKKVKRFDCVQMKNRLQAAFLRDHRGLTPAELHERLQQELATSDSPAARFWRRIGGAGPVSKVAESRATYGKRK